MSAGKESSISVTVRVRPFTEDELTNLQQEKEEPLFMGGGSLAAAHKGFPRMGMNAGIRKVINVVDDKMLIFNPPATIDPLAAIKRNSGVGRIREHRFVFDRLFDENAGQEDVYNNTTRPLLDSVLDGYHATVFAYGATGCGKTHTISGNPQAPGIIFLTMKELFERINDLQDQKQIEVTLSYLEIYNETIKDLLEPSHKQLSLREDSDQKITVSNLSMHKPENVEEVMDMILHGNKNRTVSPTEANATSSRSHAVLQINVVQKGRSASLSESRTFATLSIIDLAGSERASATKNRGDRLFEGANINKSLLALGNCINALCDPKRRNHVPYRDSKLTRLLKFSLGGNCKTVMIVCVSPSSRHYDETLNTLKYADRAKKIKTKVTRNEHSLNRHVGSYLKMIKEQRAEIEDLRRRENKAVTLALAQSEKANNKCLQALHDAVESLEKSYFKVVNETPDKKTSVIQNLIYQLQQIENLLLSHPEAEELAGGINQAAEKLKHERSLLEKYVMNHQKTLESTISILARSIEDTPGIKDFHRMAFKAHADAIRLRYSEQLWKSIDLDSTGSIALIRPFTESFYGKVCLITNPDEFSQQLVFLIDKIIILGNQEVNNNHGPSTTSSLGIKRKLSFTTDYEHTPVKTPFATSSTANVAVASATKRLSLMGVSGTAKNMVRKPVRKNIMAVRSPVRKQLRAAKRVRWEDDSDISMGSPTTPLKQNEQSPSKENDLLPTPPQITKFSSSITPPSNLEDAFPMSSTPLNNAIPKRKVSQFGVKGDLRRKSTGNTRVSLVHAPLIPQVSQKMQQDLPLSSSREVVSPRKKLLGPPSRVIRNE